ncbi:MAG: oxygen-independent coproporphyrinogen III oxidase [Burkholderiales bacterium]|nr:oxygen-independent coproporphyrinogen III oxidase [Nitrosomonas sp.]MCP5276454.1 oxygen-independent coproporphyrinogen III oxidase [Burkholderiales bacterium]
MYPRQRIDIKEVKSDLIRCFAYNDQDYTLYPGTELFTDTFAAKTYFSRISNRSLGGNRKHQALYIHLPFCSTLCLYCNTRQFENGDNALLDRYIDYLLKEIRLVGDSLQSAPKVEQIHLGGGTPALLNQFQFGRLMDEIQKQINLVSDGFFRITIDPQLSSNRSIKLFREMGINYLTIIVQQYDSQINQSPRRKQTEINSETRTFEIIEAAQSNGFNTIRIELIYGFPGQSKKSFSHILDLIVAARPNLINLRSYDPQPEEFGIHKIVQTNDLLSIEEKFDLRMYAIHRLINAGYIHIGMNLFARQDDQLVTAQRQGRLYYDLQGYSIYPDSDFIALGMSAIGKTGSILVQNHCDLPHYYDFLDQNKLPIMRGLELGLDDILRRSVIHALICHSIVSFESVETFFSIDFKDYFANELSALSVHENAGLLTISDEEISITPIGQLFVGSVCKIFDKYLRVN